MTDTTTIPAWYLTAAVEEAEIRHHVRRAAREQDRAQALHAHPADQECAGHPCELVAPDGTSVPLPHEFERQPVPAGPEGSMLLAPTTRAALMANAAKNSAANPGVRICHAAALPGETMFHDDECQTGIVAELVPDRESDDLPQPAHPTMDLLRRGFTP